MGIFATDKTTVTDAHGKELPLAKITTDDVLRGSNRKGNHVQRITHSFRSTRGDVYSINSGQLFITASQPVLGSSGDWLAIDPIEADGEHQIICHTLGEGVTLQQGNLGVAVLNITRVPDDWTKPVVTLELNGDHTFFCNDFICHNKGGGGGGNTTTVTKAEFAPEQRPHINTIFDEAQRGFEEVRNVQRPGGRLTASVNPTQQQAVSSAKSVADNVGGLGDLTEIAAQGFINQAIGKELGTLTSSNFDLSGGEEQLQSAINASLNPLQERLTEQILPQITSATIDLGAYGGSKADELTSQAVQDFLREGANISATLGYEDLLNRRNIGFEDYALNKTLAPQIAQTELALAAGGSSLLDKSVEQDLLQSNLYQQIGNTEAGFEQQDIQEQQLQYEQALQDPFRGLGQYSAFIQGFNPTGSTVSNLGGRSGGGFGGAAAGALGGALAGAKLGTVVPGIGNVVGAIGGGLLGGLGGYF